MTTTLTNKTIVVTGANRGIGQALVAEALARGARRVYAGTRQPMAHTDERVVPLALDITNWAQIEAAAEVVEGLDMLVNNAGTGLYDDLSDRASLEEHLAVNLFGPYDMVEAFLPALAASRGSVVNVLSIASLAALPIIPSYSVSKAAAFSLTQNLRPLLAPAASVSMRYWSDRPTRTCPGVSRYPRSLRSTRPPPSSTAWKPETRRSSRTPCSTPSPKAGTPVRSSLSSASSPASWRRPRSLRRPTEAPLG
jgi:NAD(P)-dependent dehydrogenase (short-subunit alcohol dehydrogenase family)